MTKENYCSYGCNKETCTICMAQGEKSVEQMCRDMLEIAIRDDLVDPLHNDGVDILTTADLAGIANYLQERLKVHANQWVMQTFSEILSDER